MNSLDEGGVSTSDNKNPRARAREERLGGFVCVGSEVFSRRANPVERKAIGPAVR